MCSNAFMIYLILCAFDHDTHPTLLPAGVYANLVI